MEQITVLSLQARKKNKQPIVALTCYDAFTAKLIDPFVDVALVGDSLANTRLGYANTVPVTMDEMLHHVRAAARGARRALLVADMPFHSYDAEPWEAAKNAGRFIKEGGAQAVKVEGARRIKSSIKAILDANVPVMGHLGLVPQSVYRHGGYHVQGRDRKDALNLMQEAKLLQSLGVFAVVLEGIPAALGKKISGQLKIPTIGIGAGAGCDGQILVLDDVLGLTEGKSPKFVKKFADLRQPMIDGVRAYQSDVIKRRFPNETFSY